jgi:hypothetical protein
VNRPGLLSTGPAVVLTGPWLAVARQAVHAATLARRRNGHPENPEHQALLDAITLAMSRNGHPPQPVAAPLIPPEQLTVQEAAAMLSKSRRQVQRLAPRLGGRRVAGRWVLDRRAVEDHLEGADG